jgi:hypothetical protein
MMVTNEPHEIYFINLQQQHGSMIGGPNALSCPVCHKLFLGGEALMEHMKYTHKDPNASGVASTINDKIKCSIRSQIMNWNSNVR